MAGSMHRLNTGIEEPSKAEKALAESERNLRQTIDTIPVMAWCNRADGSNEFLNRRWHDYTGLPPEEAHGWGWQVTLHPDDLPGLLVKWRHMLATGESGELEARLRRFDGVYRWFLFRCDPLRDDSGNILKWYGTNTDIEDRKLAEAELAAEKRLLERVARGVSLPDVLDDLCREVEELAPQSLCSVLLVDPAVKYIQSVLGPSLPESYTASLNGQAIDPNYGPCSLAMLSKETVICADIADDPRWASSGWSCLAAAHGLRSCWSTPILAGNQDALGSFAVYGREAGSPTPREQELIERFKNIAGIAIERAKSDAALKSSETELRQANDFLAQAQRLSKTGSFIWDVMADEHIWSDEIYRAFELEAGSKVTLPIMLAAIHPDDTSAIESVIKQAMAGEDFDVMFRIVAGSASVKHVHVVGHRLDQIADRPVFIGAIQDVTENQVAQEALNKARAELAHVARVMTLSTLTASLAHEVNQPLAGIIANASTSLRMLATDPPNLEGARTTAQRTIRDANRASEVIKRLREMFARRPPGKEPVDLNAAAQEVLALLSGELQRGRMMLKTDFAGDLPNVRGDRVQLQQVILNLILNAADAMSEIDNRPRELLVATMYEAGSGVRLSVRDCGVGIDPQNARKVFDAFYTTKAKGMGVGLSISRSIIESHDGRLWASGNDGPGATFSFSIPGEPATARPAGDLYRETRDVDS
jgi:PAS domain S-box-containing protein